MIDREKNASLARITLNFFHTYFFNDMAFARGIEMAVVCSGW